MFQPPSLQKEYTLCSVLDPALELPVVPQIAEGASAADIDARDKIAEERGRVYRNAAAQGSWPSITKSGQSPTVFHFRPIHGAELTWLNAQTRKLTDEQVYELAF